MSDAARRCIEALDARQQDISMLFLLAHTAWLERFAAGEKLVTWVREEVKLKIGEVTAKGFQEEVRREFSARGIRPVAPERCVHAMTKQGVKDLCLQAGWPCPFFPVMLQTRPKGAGGFDKKGRRDGPHGAFIVFSCWPDAFFALITMAGTGVYKGSAADIIFENQVADFGPKSIAFPCRIILDCDAKMAEFNNEYTLEELEQSIDAVPPWFVRELVRIKALKPTDQVVCYKKKKSRANKASAHFVFGIMGIPTEDIREVLDVIFVSRWKAWSEKEKQRLSAESSQPKKHKARGRELPEPWRVTDRSTMHGRNQFSTLLLKNPDKKETEFPFLEHRMVIVNGEVTRRSQLPFAREEYEPGHTQALQLLHCCCYSSFPQEFVTLSPDFMIRKAVKKGPAGASAGPSTSRPSLGQGFLPAWMESAVRRVTGKKGFPINKSMPCLDKLHAQLASFIPQATRSNTAHINGALFCPNHLQNPKIHSSNGIFVSVVDDVVYATCSDQSCYKQQPSDPLSPAGVDVVKGTEEWRRPWIKYTEEMYMQLEKKARQPGDPL